MPELIEQMYCSQQIVIPPKFPYILKRYAKAAIKTQPYDLLRWSFEYFKALAEGRTPPVKLRLEYPVFNTEGGLTRGYLRVLASQLEGMNLVPSATIRTVWLGSCLEIAELKRIMCICQAYNEAAVKRLHFIAVAGGLLTKCLTHTMVLLCETLTKEPDGGSAAIPVEDFLMMYRFLALMDASKDVQYINGYREGFTREEKKPTEEELEEEESESVSVISEVSDEFWQDAQELHRVTLINSLYDRSTRLSVKMSLPPIGHIERSPSAERAGQIDRDNFLRERKGRPRKSESVDKQLTQMRSAVIADEAKKDIDLGDPEPEIQNYLEEEEAQEDIKEDDKDDISPEGETVNAFENYVPVTYESEKERVAAILTKSVRDREKRIADLERTFAELSAIVDKFNAANYDLGMLAGRQMSTTSGEFIAQNIEREIMAVIDEQISVLPDPDLKKKKAKPEEVLMIRSLLNDYVEDNLSIIVPDDQEEEVEEAEIPDIITVYAVPGIGPPVDREMIQEFEEYVRDVSKNQADMIMPRNLRHFMCPPLEKFVEHDYESFKKEEEVPTVGVITD